MTWSTVQLGDVAKVMTGKSNREDSIPDGEYAFFDRSQEIRRSSRFLFDTEAVIVPGEGMEFIPRYFSGRFDLHQRVYAIMDFQGIDGKFLYYTIAHKRKYFAQVAIGTTVKSLRKGMFERFAFDCPPIKMQCRIASILSAYDDLIENNQRRIRLLEQSARSLYKEWFVRFRFPGHERVKIKDGAPENWQICGMLEHPHFEFIRENIRQFAGEKRYYATADISGITITGNGINYTFAEKPSRAQKAPEINSVWFARMQETYKVLIFTDTNRDLAEESMLSSGFAGFRARQPEFTPFLWSLINNEQFHETKDLYCTGATQRSLPDNGLKNIRTLAPPPNLLGKFADATGAMISQILTLQAANKKLAAARNLLLPRLMEGKMQYNCNLDTIT